MKKALRVAAVLLLLLAALGFFIHPYLAVSAPVECEIAVVEGWIPHSLIPKVSAEVKQRAYHTIYTTGTVRPFSYYLKNGEAIGGSLELNTSGGVGVNVSGIGGAGFILIADGDTLLDRTVSGTPTTYYAVPKRPVSQISLISTNSGTPLGDVDNIYIKHFTVGGHNIHSLLASVELLHPDGQVSSAWPTYAHLAAARLIAEGVETDRIIVAPATDRTDSRTLANATGFAQRAKVDGVDRFDVISVGVHARRSRKMYRKAMGSGAVVGVIAIPDPDMTAGNWWRHRMGRMHMLKELAGMPISTLLEVE